MEKTLKDLTDWQITQVMRGERPEGIEFDDFKKYRKDAKKLMKSYLSGKYIHISSQLVEIPGTKQFRKVTNTYVKPKTD